MAKKINTGGMGNEPWYKSRRIWGSILSGAALTLVLVFPEEYNIIVAGASGLATAFGLTSFMKPKK